MKDKSIDNDKEYWGPFSKFIEGNKEYWGPFSKFIEDNKEHWGPEFANLAGVQYSPEHNEIAAMGLYTMLYEIADNFRGGEFRAEILKLYGVK